MRRILNKKIIFWGLIIFTLAILILPNTTPIQAAATTTYQPLAGGVFEPFFEGSTNNLSSFLQAAFQFGLAMAAVLSVIMIIWGGVEIMLSESIFNKEAGRKKIQDAIWGLVLALTAWLILNTINPQILNWSFLGPAPAAQTSQ